MATTATEQPTKVITGKARLSYPNIWEPRAFGNDATGPKKYSATLIIPKSDTVAEQKIRKAIAAAAELGKSTKFNGKIPGKLEHTFYDGDGPEADGAEELKGCWYLRSNSVSKPGVIDSQKNEIMDKDEVYAGCYVKASVNFYAYNFGGNKGVACGLNNLMKVADGEPFSGRASAEDDFADEPVEDDFMS